MGAGTSSGYGAGTSGGSASKWERQIDDARWRGSGKERTFSIPGVGGAVVEARPDTATKTMKYYAYTWTPNTAATPANRGRGFNTRDEAHEYAKQTLKNRRKAELKNR